MNTVHPLTRLFVGCCLLLLATLSLANSNSNSAVTVITGSSSGLGWEISQLAMADKMRVVFVDINPGPSEQMAKQYRQQGGQAMVITADLAKPVQRKGIIAQVVTRFGQVDYLFNNAGYAYLTSLADHDMAQAKHLFEVNYWAYVDLAQQAAVVMAKQGSGVILNTSSIAGVIPVAGEMGSYAASKHALVGFFQAAATELKPKGISVKLICPGGMKTNIIPTAIGKNVAHMQHVDDNWEPASIVAKEVFEQRDNGELLQFPSIAKNMRNKYLNSLK